MGRATIKMNRAEVEKTIEPIIRKCRKKFAPGSSETEDSPDTNEPLRPETRRVSLIASLTESVLSREFSGRGLEVGSGYGCLLFPMASLFPRFNSSPSNILINLTTAGRVIALCFAATTVIWKR